MMLISIAFHPNDDLTGDFKNFVAGGILTTAEAETHSWDGRKLQYFTKESARDVIAAWEEDGFNIDEFVEFSFKGVSE